MTRIFIINTITARGEVGIKESMASVLLEPLLVLTSVGLRQLVLAIRDLEPLALAFTREPLVLTFVNRQPLVLAIRDLEPLVLLGQLLLESVPLEPLVLPFVTPEPQVVLAYKPL